MTYDSFRHHRRSIRMKKYDYASNGAYFVTVCSKNRENFFGDVQQGEMVLNSFGTIIQSVWEKLPQRFPEIELDEFVIMPNHIHGIIAIVGAGFPRPNLIQIAGEETSPLRKPALGHIIAYLKYISAKRVNELRGLAGWPIWQRNYYERIVRSDRELNSIRQYIRNNAQRWNLDPENVGSGVSPPELD